ncbi:geranylgeranyl pyrophosphate synthase-like isoform X2 [Oppia nitens]|uniref:geranylgeranyl pyrophosphate synthase-like isoform X2 n=1 Tax=Oppia nitens TaxID=1686743 RepID=UPI0023DC5605|nr:geranylgeranyl pyrophosphate synthase-like isoform X2 [Oppia nitens]
MSLNRRSIDVTSLTIIISNIQPNPEEEKILLEPYNYLLQCSGKQAFNHWFNIPSDQLVIISDIVEMLHNASLLIDDIEDNSLLRRGIPVAHNIFGIPSTINSANYVYFLSLEKTIKELPNELVPKAVLIFTEQLLELHRGQGMDIHYRDSYKCPKEDEYIDMIRKKTGGLFGLGVKLMQLFSNDNRDYSQLISYLGIYFQIRDDYANLKSLQYEENKSYCEDLTEGKFSFPIIHGIQTQPKDSTLLNILRQRTKNVELKKYAVQKLEEFGSFIHTLKTLEEINGKARHELEALGGNPLLLQLLDFLKII